MSYVYGHFAGGAVMAYIIFFLTMSQTLSVEKLYIPVEKYTFGWKNLYFGETIVNSMWRKILAPIFSVEKNEKYEIYGVVSDVWFCSTGCV